MPAITIGESTRLTYSWQYAETRNELSPGSVSIHRFEVTEHYDNLGIGIGIPIASQHQSLRARTNMAGLGLVATEAISNTPYVVFIQEINPVILRAYFWFPQSTYKLYIHENTKILDGSWQNNPSVLMSHRQLNMFMVSIGYQIGR